MNSLFEKYGKTESEKVRDKLLEAIEDFEKLNIQEQMLVLDDVKYKKFIIDCLKWYLKMG